MRDTAEAMPRPGIGTPHAPFGRRARREALPKRRGLRAGGSLWPWDSDTIAASAGQRDSLGDLPWLTMTYH